MRYTNNAIYTRVRAAVLAADSNAHCTQTYAPVPSAFPTVFMREIGHFTPNQTATISNAQDIFETTWEVQVFTDNKSKSKEDAYALMDAVKTAFRAMYFVETFEAPFDNTSNTYYTLIARFRRIIGSGENMPN